MNKFLVSIVLFVCVSCAVKPFAESDKKYKNQIKNYQKTIASKEKITFENTQTTDFVGTVNFNLRKPNLVIIHHTAQDSLAQTLKTFTKEKTQVSAHYVIADDGRVVQMLNDYMRSWHAGVGSWGNVTDINSVSIGIELDNNGTEPFSEAQINSLLVLLKKLKKDYNIPTQNFIGHSDIAPSRKTDPSILFPWKTLAENGFGVWVSDKIVPAPANFNYEMALKIIGYNTKKLPEAIKAFKLHFLQKTEILIIFKTNNFVIYFSTLIK